MYIQDLCINERTFATCIDLNHLTHNFVHQILILPRVEIQIKWFTFGLTSDLGYVVKLPRFSSKHFYKKNRYRKIQPSRITFKEIRWTSSNSNFTSFKHEFKFCRLGLEKYILLYAQRCYLNIKSDEVIKASQGIGNRDIYWLLRRTKSKKYILLKEH